MSTNKHRKESESFVARFSVLTMSDTRTEDNDTSGHFLRKSLLDLGHEEISYRLIPDDPEKISKALHEMAKDSDLLITTGGTGISKRDSTIDIALPLFEKELLGFGEIFRVLSFEEVGPAAILSRASCGIFSNCLVFCLPGSSNAVQLAMNKIIAPEIKHLLWELLIK